MSALWIAVVTSATDEDPTSIKTYIIKHYNPDQQYDQASHTTYVMLVNYLFERQVLYATADSERQIFDKNFHDNFN